MKTTSKTVDSSSQLTEEGHPHHSHTHDQIHDHAEHDHEGHDHDQQTGTAECIRLDLMGIIVVASLTGWWRPFMDRDWLRFAGTVIGGFTLYQEGWEKLGKRRRTMRLPISI